MLHNLALNSRLFKQEKATNSQFDLRISQGKANTYAVYSN